MDVQARDDYAGPRGRFYRSYIRRPRWARLVGAGLWGSDFRPLYRQMARLAELAPGSRVVDAACGAGLALEWLDPLRTPSYVGVDRSPAMLEVAQRVAERRGFTDVTLRRGDVMALPLADGEAAVGLSFNALHCLADPAGALAELARVVAPGGLVVGSSLVRGAVGRADRLLDADRTMGPGGSADDHRRWLEEAGWSDVDVSPSGALAIFTAHRA